VAVRRWLATCVIERHDAPPCKEVWKKDLDGESLCVWCILNQANTLLWSLANCDRTSAYRSGRNMEKSPFRWWSMIDDRRSLFRFRRVRVRNLIRTDRSCQPWQHSRSLVRRTTFSLPRNCGWVGDWITAGFKLQIAAWHSSSRT
jgi:hypothetical protein